MLVVVREEGLTLLAGNMCGNESDLRREKFDYA